MTELDKEIRTMDYLAELKRKKATDLYTDIEDIRECIADAEEYEKIAKWFRELRRYREMDRVKKMSEKHLDDELEERKIEMLEHAKDIRDYCGSFEAECFGCVFRCENGNGCLLRSTPDSWEIGGEKC